MPAPFVQPAPRPRDGYREDWLVRSYLARVLPPDVRRDIEPEVAEMGALAAGELWERQLADRLNEPTLVQWDAWGARVDRIEVTPLWKEAERLTVRFGLTAIPQERRHGRFSRVHQFLLVHLFHPVTDVYTCPLAMTDGATRTLLASRQRGTHRARGAAPDQPRSGRVLDQRPVDDGSDGRFRRRTLADDGAPRGRRVAPVRQEVVYLGRRVADGADAGTARRQWAGRRRARDVLRRNAR